MKKTKNAILSVIILLLITSCSKIGEESNYQLGLNARSAYRDMTMATGRMSIRADYGQRVYDFDMVVNLSQQEGAYHSELCLTAPSEIAGITATQVGFGAESKLIWGDMILETGDLSQQGLSPVTAFPLFLETLCQGYLDSIRLVETKQGTALELFSRNPEEPLGTGQEITLWIHPETYAFQGGEIFQDGQRVIACEMTDFVMN